METSVVVSRYNKNVDDWVYKFKNVDKVFIYDKENPENPYNVPVNKGNEASVYLKYIVDHYDTLTDYTFFIRDEEYSWHHLDSILDRYDDAVLYNKKYYNINDGSMLGSIVTNECYDEIMQWYSKYIEKYIPLSSLEDPDWTYGYRGCAQFLVHKSVIINLPIEFYQDLYEWIVNTDLNSSKSCRFLEWAWHLFWEIYPNLSDVL